MANSKRRENFTDRNGNMLIPINVEGGNYNEHFLTTPKLVSILLLLLGLAYIIYSCSHSSSPSVVKWVVWLSIWLAIATVVTRFIIFEEKFYYRMYLDLKENEITTPAIFWDIASIKDTDEGAIITYSDAKIAVMVKVERDTITGKTPEFRETHYDAISDFYRDLMIQKYSFVQMNIMEQAGKDNRLNELSKIVYKSDNPNICKLMEMEVGHIKNITHASLYESDYFLIYTNDLTKMDSIISDVTEDIFKLLDGAYIGYQILSSKDIVDLLKEEFGVTYFNYTEASLLMYNNNKNSMVTPFNITGILWTDGENQTLNNREINKLRGITSSVIKETLKSSDVSLKKSIYRKEVKNKVGVDFSSLSETTVGTNSKTKNNIIKPSRNHNGNNGNNRNSGNNSDDISNNVETEKLNLHDDIKTQDYDEEYIDL